MSSPQTSWQKQLAAGATAVVVLAVAGAQVKRWQWRARRRAGRAAAPEAVAAADDPLRVGFSSRKLPPEIDHVIIGSGLSGLYLAALLSRLGRRVVVLEQHYVAGGCTHTFRDKGFEFDTGVHYVGMATQFAAFLDFAAGGSKTVSFQKLGTEDGSEVYNELFLGGELRHRYRPGPRTFVADLVARYPQEERALRRFFKEVKKAGSGMSTLLVRQLVPPSVWRAMLLLPGPIRWVVGRYVNRSLAQALTDCGIQDEALRATISAEFGDYGMLPEEAPFCLHAGILGHYLPEGGFYPRGGSDVFASALVPQIVEAGGAVLVRAPVERVVVERGRAVGVELAGGKGVVRARRSVISSAGVEATYRRLLSEVEVQKAGGPPASLLDSERSAIPISHHIYGFVGFDGTSEELGLPSWNLLSFPPAAGASPGDLTAIWRGLHGAVPGQPPAFLASDEAAEQAQVPVFLAFPSAKDPTYGDRCPGKSCAVLLTESSAEYFAPAGPVNKRGEAYAQVKARCQTVLLSALFRHFPHLRSKVSYVDVATPLSNEHYLGRASSYGLRHDAKRFIDPTLRVAVPGLSGLYLTGQDIMCDGIWPQVLSAWLTLSKVLGVTSVDFWLLFSDFVLFTGRRVLFDRTYAPAKP